MKAKCLVATALTTVTLVFSLILAMPVSAALDDVEWECFSTDEPVTSGMEIFKRAGTNPEDRYFVCVPVDRNIGLPKRELVKCKCDIWSDIDDIDAFSLLTGGTRYIWAKDCNDIEHCECTEVEEHTLTLKHYPPYSPYYEPTAGERYGTGNLVATLTDKNNKGVSGKKVFFYVKAGTNLDRVLVFPGYSYWDSLISSMTGGSNIGHDYTSGDGKVCIEYVSCFRPETLSEIIRAGGNVKGTITAVVLNEKLTAIEQEASVGVELSSVARITKIVSLDTKKKYMVRVRPIGSETGKRDQKQVLSKQLPYDLLCGDVILLNESDIIDVQWLTGTKMIIQPKTGFLKKKRIC